MHASRVRDTQRGDHRLGRRFFLLLEAGKAASDRILECPQRHDLHDRALRSISERPSRHISGFQGLAGRGKVSYSPTRAGEGRATKIDWKQNRERA